MKTKLKKMFFYIILGLILAFLFAAASNYWIINNTKHSIYSSINEIPKNKVGLVLGTGKYIGAYENRYYTYRLNAAAKLFKKGKVKHLILSGDNGRKGYDEPTSMKIDLMKMGITEKAISLDYAGFRTLDSVVRAKEVFGQKKITIISQEFHNQRALFLSQQYDIEAIAFNAKSPFITRRMRVREFFAKPKAILDVFVLNKKPKFLGKKIEINID